MAKYYARMMDSATGGEGAYEFDAPPDLMKSTADEIVATFFDFVEDEVLRNHADWELNGVMKNADLSTVVAMGTLIPQEGDKPMPFALFIADRK